MSKLATFLRKAKVPTSKSSGFDLSHYRLTTGKCGQLIPVMCAEVLPRDKWSLGVMSQIDLPPAATNFQGRIDMRLEAFFVPNRLLWGGWESFITMPTDNPYSFNIKRSSRVPALTFSPSSGDSYDEAELQYFASHFGVGSLADNLGFRAAINMTSPTAPSTRSLDGVEVVCPNALPFLAYHRIYDDWYRDSRVQTPLFVNNSTAMNNFNLYQIPWFQAFDTASSANRNLYIETNPAINVVGVSTQFYNGDDITTIHQRNWADDLYTTCSLYPQAAISPASAPVESSAVTIPAIRMANIAQRFKERYNTAGQKYIDQMFAAWDIKPADAILQRPMWLGSFSHGVYSSPIFSSTSTDTPNTESKNPYNGELGSSAGSVSGYGKNSLIDSFTATEHGYIIVLASLVPHAFYSYGIPEMYLRSELGDFADPLLQGLGDQAVSTTEIDGVLAESRQPFGYRQQYATYKYLNDEVCSLFRAGAKASGGQMQLSPYCLQRDTRRVRLTAPTLDSEFLQIPTDFLDQVFNVEVSNSGWSWRGYFYFSCKCVRALAEYVIPTLENTQHMYNHSVNRGGSSING